MERRGSGKDNEEREKRMRGGWKIKDGEKEVRESSVPFHPPANILSGTGSPATLVHFFSSSMENTPGG